ncbi:MAG TPA: PAC2 family protein [Ktedonobacterales bacterium]
MANEAGQEHDAAREEPLSEALHITELPELQNPLLIAAFAGWNDAAGAASWAVHFLVDRWGARRFAEIDAEEFFAFTDTRPQTRLTGGVVREITWPGNEFYYARRPEPPEGATRPRRRAEPSRDVILLMGTEPNLRWKTFTRIITGVCRRLNVAQVALLGGLLADVPHTRPVPITAASTTNQLAEELARMGMGGSKYQGPTGILGVLHDACRQEHISALSLWGAAPHYLTVSPNLQVSVALLARLNEVLGLRVNLRELQLGATRFQERVSAVVAQDQEAANYVRQLEERLNSGADEDIVPLIEAEPGVAGESQPPRPSGDLPSAEVLIQDIEELLRQNRRGDSSDDEGAEADE